MAQLHNYHILLETEATRRKLRVGYSEPEIVNGSINPPPSRFYPGKRCFMVTAAVNGREFRGFGPSEAIAKSSAAYEAYKSLFKRNEASSSVATRDKSQSPLELFEIPCMSATDSSQETPLPSQSSSSPWKKGNGSLLPCSLSKAQSSCVHLPSHARRPSTAQKYYIPQTQQEAKDRMIRNPLGISSQSCANSTKCYASRSRVSGLLDELLKQARKKGVKIQFEVVHGGNSVTVRALAGLLSKEATSKKIQVARYIALRELMTEVEKESKSCLPVSELAKPIMHATNLPSCVRSSDPVGQLNEVAMERGEDVQFSFCFHGKGFWCCAMTMNKSSLGFGSTKQLAKEMAAQNMLSLLWYKGISILPQCKQSSARRYVGGSHCGGECAELPYTHQKPPLHPLEQMLSVEEESHSSNCLPPDQHPLVVDTRLANGDDDGGLPSPFDFESTLPEEQISNLTSQMTNMSLSSCGTVTKESFFDDTEVLCGTDVVLSSEGAVCLPSAGSVDLYKDMPSLL